MYIKNTTVLLFTNLPDKASNIYRNIDINLNSAIALKTEVGNIGAKARKQVVFSAGVAALR